jgi:hypothetical protein
MAIEGHVVDKNRRPLEKVQISVKGKVVAQSGADGFFSVDVPKSARRVAVTFNLAGYVSNTRVLDARGGGTTIIIWAIAYRVGFDTSRDLDVQLGGSTIQIPANALVAIKTKKPVARAEVRFTWFDVTNRFDRAAAPGDFSGRYPDGTVRRLDSYGIFDLDIAGRGGESLALRPDARIALAVAVPEKLVRRAPRSVGFFDFDTASGIWIHVGSFDFVPSTLTYNGSITRFGGAQNCDEPQDVVCITVQVISVWNSAPMPNMSVVAHGGQYDSYGTTDANGFVCLLVQKNSSVTLEAYGSVGSSFWMTPPWMQPTFATPNITSGAGDCGDPVKCPLLGTVPVDLIVGGTAAQTAIAIQ